MTRRYFASSNPVIYSLLLMTYSMMFSSSLSSTETSRLLLRNQGRHDAADHRSLQSYDHNGITISPNIVNERYCITNMDQYDTNSDGTLNFTEYRNFFTDMIVRNNRNYPNSACHDDSNDDNYVMASVVTNTTFFIQLACSCANYHNDTIQQHVRDVTISTPCCDPTNLYMNVLYRKYIMYNNIDYNVNMCQLMSQRIDVVCNHIYNPGDSIIPTISPIFSSREPNTNPDNNKNPSTNVVNDMIGTDSSKESNHNNTTKPLLLSMFIVISIICILSLLLLLVRGSSSNASSKTNEVKKTITDDENNHLNNHVVGRDATIATTSPIRPWHLLSGVEIWSNNDVKSSSFMNDEEEENDDDYNDEDDSNTSDLTPHHDDRNDGRIIVSPNYSNNNSEYADHISSITQHGNDMIRYDNGNNNRMDVTCSSRDRVHDNSHDSNQKDLSAIKPTRNIAPEISSSKLTATDDTTPNDYSNKIITLIVDDRKQNHQHHRADNRSQQYDLAQNNDDTNTNNNAKANTIPNQYGNDNDWSPKKHSQHKMVVVHDYDLIDDNHHQSGAPTTSNRIDHEKSSFVPNTQTKFDVDQDKTTKSADYNDDHSIVEITTTNRIPRQRSRDSNDDHDNENSSNERSISELLQPTATTMAPRLPTNPLLFSSSFSSLAKGSLLHGSKILFDGETYEDANQNEDEEDRYSTAITNRVGNHHHPIPEEVELEETFRYHHHDDIYTNNRGSRLIISSPFLSSSSSISSSSLEEEIIFAPMIPHDVVAAVSPTPKMLQPQQQHLELSDCNKSIMSTSSITALPQDGIVVVSSFDETISESSPIRLMSLTP